MLQKNTVLHRLTIDGSGIQDDGASEIAHALQTNTALRELSIMGNELSGVAAKHFADALEKRASGLVELSLGYQEHGMSPEWWHYIQTLLICNAAAHRNKVGAGDCKEVAIEAEEERVCKILAAAALPCGVFLTNRLTTLGDLIALTTKRCIELEDSGLPSGLVGACMKARDMAKGKERQFGKDDVAL